MNREKSERRIITISNISKNTYLKERDNFLRHMNTCQYDPVYSEMMFIFSSEKDARSIGAEVGHHFTRSNIYLTSTYTQCDEILLDQLNEIRQKETDILRQLLFSRQESHSKYELLYDCKQLKPPKADVNVLPPITNPLIHLPLQQNILEEVDNENNHFNNSIEGDGLIIHQKDNDDEDEDDDDNDIINNRYSQNNIDDINNNNSNSPLKLPEDDYNTSIASQPLMTINQIQETTAINTINANTKDNNKNNSNSRKANITPTVKKRGRPSKNSNNNSNNSKCSISSITSSTPPPKQLPSYSTSSSPNYEQPNLRHSNRVSFSNTTPTTTSKNNNNSPVKRKSVDLIDTSRKRNKEKVYEVERILDKRITKDKIEYKVHWKGYTSDDDTWEPVTNFLDVTIITNYEDQLAKNEL